MLLDKRELTGIEAGTITTVFRHWRTPRIRVGTRLRTPVGLVEITALTRTAPGAVTETEALAAGFDELGGFHDWLDDRPGDLFRVDLKWVGVDPRVALREMADLDEAGVSDLRGRLERMDARADSPWTWETLRLIATSPGVVSTELAATLGLDRTLFKQRVRRLKELGLTESLEVGYRISPRGRALLEAGAENA